ncbi:MAG: MBOAT family O-acyltransferase [Blastocatellales bacterium]
MLSFFDLTILWQLWVCVLLSILMSIWPGLSRSRWLWVIGVVAVILSFRQTAPGYLFCNLLVYGCARGFLIADVNHSQRRWRLACVAMVILLAAFLAGRHYQLEKQTVSLLGVQLGWFSLNMWSFLRLLTLLWESGSGRIRQLSFPSYLVWCCLPFTLNGPLLRYSQFEQQLIAQSTQPQQTSGLNLSAAWWRNLFLAAGHFLSGILLSGLQAYLGTVRAGSSWWGKLSLWFFIAPWAFYLVTGGYFRLMECLAVCWGFNLPASFNWPFGRRNISDFWANWNMTATNVFRDYFFYNRWGMKKINVYLNTMILFVLVGLWHGSNGYWITWGAMHGIGFCVFLWHKQWRRKFDASTDNQQATVGKWLAAAATYVFVCSCWVLPPQILKFIK